MPTNKTQTLTALEQLEASQINCGCYVTQVSFADIREQIPSSNLSDSDIREALQQLIDDQEVIEWQPQSYRSRIAETVRILRLLRQRFWNSKSLANSPLLIEDVRVEFRQRHRPNRNAVRVEEAIPTEVKFPARQQFLQVLQAIGFNNFSQFQQRAIQDIFACSQQKNANNDSFIIAGDTGAGKTEAFLFPILLDIINESTEKRQHPGVRAVLVYPRIRLARNQLARLLRYIGLLRASGAPPITVGIQNGDTPRNRQTIQEKWSETGYSNRYLVRLLESCIECEEGRYWVERTELEKDCPHLICDRCGHSIDSLYLTQETLSEQAPDLLIITDVSLSQWMVRERYTHLWGLWSGEKQTIPPRYLVLDEVHLYEQIKGSHISRLIKRFQSRVRLVYKKSEQPERNPIIIGVSATLNDERAFLAKLLNVSPSDTDSYSKLKVIKPYDNELEDTEGRERYIFICPRRLSPTLKNPEYRVNDQTAAIQIVMAVMHNLKREIEWRGLAFFDSINDLRQFTNDYHKSRDSANSRELWRIRTDKNLHQGCGGSNCLKCLEDKSLDSCPHFQAGDCWLFAQFGGWNSKLKVADSVYAGSAGELDGTDLIPSSPSLEVGYDDDAIQLVYQHKAPPNVASFIQRRGRAGRSPNDSPIIVTMLWPNRSGDMFYYYHPEALYNPSFDDAPLNANNFNVQRTHTLLAFFDLLACLRVQNIDNLQNDPEIIDFTQAGNEFFLISDQIMQSWRILPDSNRFGQNKILVKHRITKQDIWFSGGQLNHIEQSNEGLKVKGWLALNKELTFKVLRRAWEYLSTSGLFENYLEISKIASSTFKQHSTYPYQIKKGNTLPNVLDQFGNKEWHSNHDRIEKSNWIKTFRYIDWMLQGKEDATTLIVHYTDDKVTKNNAEKESNEATLDLTFALTELLPGNVSYRLREKQWIHWTPIPKEGESTFLYPTEAELDDEQNIIGEKISYEPKIEDIASQSDSIFGIPRYLDQNFPNLRLMTLQRLRVEKFGRPSDKESYHWCFDPDENCAVPIKKQQKRPSNFLQISKRTTSRANSIVIPYIASDRSVERKNLGFPLNRLFSTIEGYVTEGKAMLGYTRVFYEMQIDLKTKGRKENKTLLRKFYPPHPKKDDQGNPQPILVGYSVETQGITFHLNSDLLNELTQTLFNDDQLRFSLRRKMALYYFSYYATENKRFMATILKLAEVVVDYWLHKVIPNSDLTPRSLDFSRDIKPLEKYYWHYRNIQEGDLTEFQEIVNEDFIENINPILAKSFKNTQDFYDFIKSTALHSLSSLLKTLIARLGGVSSEDLVAYADLPILEKVDKGINPRMIIMDKVEGGSGAIAQAFERLELSSKNEKSEASLWWILQRDLGQCPIAQGEAVVQNVLTQATEKQIKKAQNNPTPKTVKKLLNDLNLSTPSAATQRLGRTLFSDLKIGESDINPALILKELTALHNQLNAQSLGIYSREAVVSHVVKTLEANTYPHLNELRKALKSNGVESKNLDYELALQLKTIYTNSCEDGCPVCMSEGSDIEHHQLASLLRSRKVLNQLREQLFKPSPTSDCLANLADSLRTGESVQVGNNTTLLDEKIHPQLGIATLQKVSKTGELNGSIVTPLDEGILPNDEVWRERWDHDKYKPYPLPPDGERRVRSRGEYIIATQLINEKIEFDYESPISYKSDDGTVRRIHPDFYLFEYGLYVEYWGLNDTEYLESRRFKEKVYKKRKIKPINIEKDEIENNRFMDKIKRRIKEEGEL